ncbi:MAG TPA: amidohydrolase family protein [Saprospiraceae bacterium]|nr:amidohydrolase family protein [Saprospiraceae bacterium]
MTIFSSRSARSGRRMLPVLLAFFVTVLTAQEKPKWDVNQPAGQPYKEVSFTTSEGTWMCLDVSPDGNSIVFDLLGDIYTMPIDGGAATCIRSGIAWEVQPRFSPDGKKILFTSDAGGGDNIWMMNPDGTKAKQITKESFRLLNNAVWIDNDYFVARKHFTNTRSLGAGEMWMYHITGGEGIQLTKRKNDQQDVNEPSVAHANNRYVYFSEDMSGGGSFQYNKNPNTQIFAIRRYDREEGKVEEVTGGSGGACRPQVSPDGKWLAFVRRDYTKTVLCLRDLATGLEFPLYDGLNKDQQEAWTTFGCYPGFSWMPDGKAIVLWAGGKIKKVTPNFSRADPGQQASVSGIPFSCSVKTKVAETLRFENKAFEPEFTAHAIRYATTSPDGKTLLFSAAGEVYQKSLVESNKNALIFPVQCTKDEEDIEAEPAFAPDGKSFVLVAWDDVKKGSLIVCRYLPTGGISYNILTQTQGIYRTPSFSPDGKQIVFVLQNGDDELGPAMTDKPGIYIIDTDGKNLRFVAESGENPRFSADGKRIYVNTGGALFGALDKSLKSCDLNGKDERTHIKSKYAGQFVISPDGKWVAFSELFKTYVCLLPEIGKTMDLSADTKAVPATQVSRDAGYNLHWSGDGKKLHYTLGDEYFTIDLNKRFAFLEGAPDTLPPLDTAGLKIGLKIKSDSPEGSIVFKNARIITMENDRVIEKGVLAVEGNKIVFAGSASEYRSANLKLNNPKVIDCAGKTIMPGMIDVHAHPGNFRYGLNPQKQWEYYAQLAYGVTTQHDPSVNSEMAFSNAELLKSGRMVGPRLFSTGTILYGADGDFKATINSIDDARSALRRTKAWGAISVKSYNQPRREQRQQVIAAARELGMLVVPEGGSFFNHNMTQIVDGHSSIEHNLPVAPLYSDVITLWSQSKTSNTPTLIVSYGSLFGENYWYQQTDVWKKERLLQFTPKHILDERSRHRNMAPEEEYRNGHILISQSSKKLTDAGVNINLGAHGQLNGLGAHWELWMLQQGGMTNLQALKCATLNGATHLGLDKEIGSLKAGKLADLLVLDSNPLEDIRNSESIRYVMLNGRLYDAATLNEVGNYDKKRSKFWFELPGNQTSGAGMSHTCLEAKCACQH